MIIDVAATMPEMFAFEFCLPPPYALLITPFSSLRYAIR